MMDAATFFDGRRPAVGGGVRGEVLYFEGVKEEYGVDPNEGEGGGFSPTMAVAAWFGPNFNERTTTPVRFGARAWTLSHDGEGLNLERGKICAGRGNR
jgi:hypothetical protein